MQKKLLFLTLLITFAGMTSSAFAAVTLPNPLCLNPATPCVSSPTCTCNFTDLITKIINFVLIVIGSVAVLMLVWAGILFVTSAGSPEKISKGKQALTYAIIGLVIAFAGGGLILVIKEVIGVSPTP